MKHPAPTPTHTKPLQIVNHYPSLSAFQKDAPLMAALGYEYVSVQMQPTHVNVGRTILRVLTVVGLIFGVSRSRPTVLVTYRLVKGS